MMFDFYSNRDDEFEISLVVRDHNGNPTGQRKTYSTHSAYKLWLFFNRFQGKPKRRRKKKDKKNEKSNQTFAEE
jgi:hypothetical protein